MVTLVLGTAGAGVPRAPRGESGPVLTGPDCLRDSGYPCFVAVLCEGDGSSLCSVRSRGTCEKSGLAHAGRSASRRGSR